MTESPQVGEVHSIPESESEVPAGKRPKVVVSRKHPNHNAKRFRNRGDQVKALPEPCSPEDVLWRDVIALLGQDMVDKALKDKSEFKSPFSYHQEVELEISSLLPSGEAIARWTDDTHPWAVVIPFALSGERVRVRIYRSARLHSYGDLLEVIRPNSDLRDSSRVKCQYFGTCAGCQFQMLSYETQLDFKRDVVNKAYENFSDLPESSVPNILATVGSPLQYGYRTKLTPHFEAPPKNARNKKNDDQAGKPEWLKIGFNRIGTSKTMDIEECPIATPVINEALGPVRANIIENIYTYKKGVSLLFRQSLQVTDGISGAFSDTTVDTLANTLDRQVCITDHKGTVREKVGDWIFEYTAGSFFQNNNSVLIPLTNYVRNAIFPPSPLPSAATEDLAKPPAPLPRPTHLVDAYCGAGLFAITLSPHFNTVTGIELSADSIKCATHNASLNNISSSKITFRAGDAADIFATVGDFPPNQTVLVIDPPRKGCDENFIEQLVKFRCRTVVYVSCNVHTQARDVGRIVKATEGDGEGRRYKVESVRGFDLFPQTAHVESVAVLRLV